MRRILFLICLLFPFVLMGQYGHGGYGSGISGDSVNVGGSTDYVGISNNVTGMVVLNAATAGNYYGIKFTGSAWNDNYDKLIYFDANNNWDASGKISATTVNAGTYLQIGGTGCFDRTDGINNLRINYTSNSSSYISLYTGGYNQRLIITTMGLFGIGTTSPQYKIGVVDATPILNLTDSDVNIITSSTAQASDSQAINIDASLAQPQVKITQSLGYNQRVQYALEGWVTHDNDTVTVGVLPANAIVTNVNLWTQEAFNSDGTDEVCCGFTGTAEAYAVDVDVSDTGVETWSVGSVAKTVDATSRTVVVYYHSSDATNLTTGECHVLVEWYQATVNP